MTDGLRALVLRARASTGRAGNELELQADDSTCPTVYAGVAEAFARGDVFVVVD
jgi:hypothetical protein